MTQTTSPIHTETSDTHTLEITESEGTYRVYVERTSLDRRYWMQLTNTGDLDSAIASGRRELARIAKKAAHADEDARIWAEDIYDATPRRQRDGGTRYGHTLTYDD